MNYSKSVVRLSALILSVMLLFSNGIVAFADETNESYTDANELISAENIQVSGLDKSYYYNISPIAPKLTLKYENKILTEGTDYSLSYSNNINVGTAKVTVLGKGAFTGNKALEYKIINTPINKTIIKGFNYYKKYTEKAVVQNLKIFYNNKKLIKNKDYSVSYKNNINKGTASVTIIGKGNFSGRISKKFKIVKVGWEVKNGNKYCYGYDGKLLKGYSKFGKSYYLFSKSGVLQKGWQNVKGKYYYFDRKSGKQIKGKTVNGIKINKKGEANESDKNKILTMIEARKIMLKITKPTDSMAVKRMKCFKWILSLPYHQFRELKPIYNKKGWEITFANDIFKYRSGCCVSQSAACAFLFLEIGYTDISVCHDSEHAWLTIGDRIYDPVFAEAKSFSKNYDAVPTDYRVNPFRKLRID